MEKITAKIATKAVLLETMYQTPEAIQEEILLRYNKYYKVSNIERRLRELANEGYAIAKSYPNEGRPGRHNRWKKKTLADKGKIIGSIFNEIIEKGEM